MSMFVFTNEPVANQDICPIQLFRRFLRVLILGAIATVAGAQDVPPISDFSDDPEAIRTGMGVYRLRCADCHGTDARGVRAPDLTQLWASGRTDEGIFRTITQGIPNTVMRPIDRIRTRDSEIWQVIAYLRSISASTSTHPTGDAGRGEQIFQGSCSACHQVDFFGGHLGPDLSRVGIARSVESLVSRIRGERGMRIAPTRAVVGGAMVINKTFAQTSLTADSGESIQGVKHNEDLFSIQVIDLGGRIQGFNKENLQTLEVSTESLMPVFGPEMISDAALEDLVSYLVTLRGHDAAVQ